MNQSLVLISHTQERHNPLIKSEAMRRGITVHHLELGLDAAEYAIESDGFDLQLSLRGETYGPSASAQSSVLFVPFIVSRPDTVLNTKHDFARREWNAALDFMLYDWWTRDRSKWLIRPDAASLQDRKLFVLSEASRMDLEILGIPETRVGNRFGEIPSACVVKSINAWQEIRPGRFFNTSAISLEQLGGVLPIKIKTPVILQERIPHRSEMRAYVARENIKMIEIQTDDEVVDFRLLATGQANEVECDTKDLAAVGRDLRAICKRLELNYCCFDIILTDQGSKDYFLVDINATGSWEYIFRDFGIDLTGFVIENRGM